MGLRCTVTGHRWGEPRTRTEREEGDDEVAVSTVEYEVCEVCGEERVVSQNTEVRAKDDGSEESEDAEGSGDVEASEEAVEGDTESNDETYSTGAGGMGMVSEVDEDDDAVVLESDDSKDRDLSSSTDGTAIPGTKPTTVYVCSCGFESPVHENSLREGDICPACGKSYLEETERS
ncbi:MAG: hypothetical protein SV253_05065 [Halobacteria archaeon]|nr:hypothetical protein [Halobacteria archaeon]